MQLLFYNGSLFAYMQLLQHKGGVQFQHCTNTNIVIVLLHLVQRRRPTTAGCTTKLQNHGLRVRQRA